MDVNTEETKAEEAEWLPEKFNQAASPEQIMEIQKRVQARHSCTGLINGIRDGIRKSNTFSEDAVENAAITSLYIHTAFEIGHAAGLNDLDHLVEGVINKGYTPPEGFDIDALKKEQ